MNTITVSTPSSKPDWSSPFRRCTPLHSPHHSSASEYVKYLQWLSDSGCMTSLCTALVISRMAHAFRKTRRWTDRRERIACRYFMSKQQSPSQGRICLDKYMWCHMKQTVQIRLVGVFFPSHGILTPGQRIMAYWHQTNESWHTDTSPTSPSSDPMTSSVLLGRHYSTTF